MCLADPRETVCNGAVLELLCIRSMLARMAHRCTMVAQLQNASNSEKDRMEEPSGCTVCMMWRLREVRCHGSTFSRDVVGV
jgi:hypothetical protein